MNLHIKSGDTIEFYISCNADRKLYTGEVEHTDQLGLITIVDDVQYELRKLIDIKVLSKSDFKIKSIKLLNI